LSDKDTAPEDRQPADDGQPKSKVSFQSLQEWLKKNYGMASLMAGLAILAFSISFATVLFVRASNQGEEISTEAVLTDGQKVLVRKDKSTGVPTYLTGNVTPPQSKPKSPEAVVAFFDANKDLYNMNDPATELAVKRSDTDNLGMTHVRMNQLYGGVPVFGAEMVVHFSPANKIQTVNGNYIPGIDVNTEADVAAEAAVSKAKGDLGSNAGVPAEQPPQLMIFSPDGKSQVLAWKITLVSEAPPTQMLYFVDAHSGEIAGKINNLKTW
jgi:Zn-dependent metalloprotease